MRHTAILILFALPLGGCGALVGQMIARDKEESLTAGDYALPMERAEREVRALLASFRIEVVETKKDDGEIVIKGRSPSDMGVKARLRQLRGDVVRVTFLCGSFFGTLFDRSEEIKLEIELRTTLQRRLHAHEVGG